MRTPTTKVIAASAIAWLASACIEGGIPETPFEPETVSATLVTSEVAAAADHRGFSDQAGGGIFLGADGAPVRLRIDGTRAALEAHPGNPAPPGAIQKIHGFGPHAALVLAANGPYVAQAGWLIAPAWSTVLPADGFVGLAELADGSLWIAHANGLFRLKDGQLAELKIEDASATDITALAPGISREGESGLWIARGGKLLVVIPYGAEFRVKPSGLTEEQEQDARNLAGLSAGVTRGQELWIQGTTSLLQRTDDGWHLHDLGAPVDELLGAGRYLWARIGETFYRFDADAQRWQRLEGVSGGTLVAVDPSGGAWLRRDGKFLWASVGLVPRISGLDQDQRVTDDQLVVRAHFPGAQAPEEVVFKFSDGEEVTAAAPHFSLGGVDVEGRAKPFSLSGLTEGRHTLSVTARFAGGAETTRVVPFEFKPESLEPLSWDKDIRPIYEARCAKCHQTGPGRQLATYEQWKEQSDLMVNAVVEKRMPADGPLDLPLVVKIQRWAQSGAKP